MGDDSVKMVYIKRLRGWLSGRSLPGRGGGGVERAGTVLILLISVCKVGISLCVFRKERQNITLIGIA